MVRVQYCFTKILIEFELLGHGSRPSSSQRAVGSSQNKGGGLEISQGILKEKVLLLFLQNTEGVLAPLPALPVPSVLSR